MQILVYPKFFHKTVPDKWPLHKKNVRQIANGLKCSFVEHWWNSAI